MGEQLNTLYLVEATLKPSVAVFARDPSDAKRKVEARIQAALPQGDWQYHLTTGQDMTARVIGFVTPDNIPPLAD